MTHKRHQLLRLKAGDLSAAVRSLLSALQRDIEVINAQLQDAVEADVRDDVQRLNEQRDRLSMEAGVLRDQVAVLERLANGGVRLGREAAALIYVDQLAQAFLLVVDDIKDRASRLLSPAMIERLPAWEAEAARTSVAEAESAAVFLQRALDR